MADVRVIGVDPGPVPGIVVLDIIRPAAGVPWVSQVETLQCSAGLAIDVVHMLCASAPDDLRVQVEKFVTKGRANTAQQITRDMVGALRSWVEHYERPSTGAAYYERPAVGVKPWATDSRLERAGLVEATKGMRHARDAARHALFCAVHDAGVPDPLSKEWT